MLPQHPPWEVAVPIRPRGQMALSAARNSLTSEPRFSEAGAGGAALRAAPPAPGSGLCRAL
eukprot:12647104-Alexandrium_andersonii.AAC.1